MPRALWSGSISFGLVNVPVRAYSAVTHRDVRFHQLHDADHQRIKYQRVCAVDGEEVTSEHIVKGYEVAPGEYVVIEPAELEALDPEATHTIDIESFAALEEIDPVFYDTSYVLVPAAGGAKPYALLLKAMAAADRVALARVVLRTKQYLVALRPRDNALVMTTMNYADELVPQDRFDGLPDADVAATERELDMAHKLIEALSEPFQPEQYRDEYRDKVMELVEAKAHGETVQVAKPEPTGSPVNDLMAALEASLSASRDARSGGAADPKKTPKAKPKPKPKAHA